MQDDDLSTHNALLLKGGEYNELIQNARQIGYTKQKSVQTEKCTTLLGKMTSARRRQRHCAVYE